MDESFESKQRASFVSIIGLVGMAEASGKSLDPVEIADELEVSVVEAVFRLELLDRYGLISRIGSFMEPSFIITPAGSQYLDGSALFDSQTIRFLPSIDNLYCRYAIRAAGTILVDEFRAQMLEGNGREFVQTLIPEAFYPAIDDRMILQFYGAVIALIIRLEENSPAACVGEELVAVQLVEGAELQLEMLREKGELSDERFEEAKESLRDLFEFFGDDDVLNMFEMKDPSDAAVSGHSSAASQLGVVDQRPENWFAGFGDVVDTGYLDDRKP